MFIPNAVRNILPSLPAHDRLRIAIVGRGPAGMTTAIALLRRLRQPFHLWVIDASEQAGSFGAGPAGQALMSEPAGQLSAFADRPSDFVDWLEGSLSGTYGAVRALHGFENVYVPRSVFRDYLVSRFGEAFADRRDVTVQIVSATVDAAEEAANGRVTLRLDGGNALLFDHVFLATGYGSKVGEASAWQAAERILRGTTARGNGGSNVPILLAGDGPRMAAILMYLRSSGFAGRVQVISKGGYLPLPNSMAMPGPFVPAVSAGTGLAESLHNLRDDCLHAGGGSPWQTVIDGLNGQWPALWRALPDETRQRYWRHLRRLHRVHTERISPDLHRRLMRELDNPATEILDARIVQSAPDSAMLWRSGSRNPEIVPGRYIDCREDIGLPADGLLGANTASVMAVEDDGQLTRDRAVVPGLYVVGHASGELRPTVRTFPDTVRQVYRAAVGIPRRQMAARTGGL